MHTFDFSVAFCGLVIVCDSPCLQPTCSIAPKCPVVLPKCCSADWLHQNDLQGGEVQEGKGGINGD